MKVKAKKKEKIRHGKYVLMSSKGLFIFDTRLKRGRALRKIKKDFNFTFQSHPKMVKSIIKKGRWTPCIQKFKDKKGG